MSKIFRIWKAWVSGVEVPYVRCNAAPLREHVPVLFAIGFGENSAKREMESLALRNNIKLFWVDQANQNKDEK